MLIIGNYSVLVGKEVRFTMAMNLKTKNCTKSVLFILNANKPVKTQEQSE